jgi:urea transporter
MTFSIIVPTFNEGRIIANTLGAIRHHLSTIEYELIVTDDGSPDRTYGFNAVLSGIALGGRPDGLACPRRFLVLNWWSTIYSLIGAIFSAIVFAAIAVALSPIGMPALTAPFVLTTWVFVLPAAGFRALQRASVAEVRTPE